MPPSKGRRVDLGYEVPGVPERLLDDGGPAGQVSGPHGAPHDGAVGLLGEVFGLVSRRQLRGVVGVEHGEDDACRVVDGAEDPVRGVGEELGARLEVEDAGDERAGRAEDFDGVGSQRGRDDVRVAEEVVLLNLELGCESGEADSICRGRGGFSVITFDCLLERRGTCMDLLTSAMFDKERFQRLKLDLPVGNHVFRNILAS